MEGKLEAASTLIDEYIDCTLKNIAYNCNSIMESNSIDDRRHTINLINGRMSSLNGAFDILEKLDIF